MGWFSNLTESIGGGVSDLLGGILNPVSETVNNVLGGLGSSGVLDTAGATSFLGGLGSGLGGGGIGGLGAGALGALGGQQAGGQTKDQTGQAANSKYIGWLIGGGLLVVGGIIYFSKNKKKR